MTDSDLTNNWSDAETAAYQQWMFSSTEPMDLDTTSDDWLANWQERVWIQAYRLGVSPDGDLTQLQVAATTLHEAFTNYREAGFTETQALQLLGDHIRAAGTNQ